VTLSFQAPGDVALRPAQRACAWFFLVMAALFLIQTLVGAASEHYRADLAGFFEIDLAQVLPYNLMRTWHVQLAIFWVATSFLAAGIFLAPMISGREPRGQHFLAYGLLGALAVVVFGSMIGERLGIFGFMGGWWSWFGNQGFEYLDLGRFWQVLLSIGLFFWVAVLFRGLRGRLRREHAANMPWLFFFTALAIPAFYAVGLLARPESHFTTADFWRFWVVHLWVEEFLELFTTVMVAYIFVLLGVVREKAALTVICPTAPTPTRAGRWCTRWIPGPHSEAGRFHRDISLAVVLIAGLILRGRVPPQPLTVRAGHARRRFPGRHADSLAPAGSLPCQPGQLPDLCAAGSRGTRPPGIHQGKGPYVGVGSWVSRA
jgi:Cytochrome C and Quinol oxidase polypeptide I